MQYSDEGSGSSSGKWYGSGSDPFPWLQKCKIEKNMHFDEALSSASTVQYAAPNGSGSTF
jgi:hypothetical protein